MEILGLSYDSSTLEAVRAAVARVTAKDFRTHGAETALNLDSINRISLIVELENAFQVELSSVEIVPEMFHSLASLAAFIDSFRQKTKTGEV